MSTPPVTVSRSTTLSEALETMDRLQHRHLVVVNRQGELKGMLTTNDIVQFLTDQFPEDTVNLPPRLRQQYRSVEGA
jgi:CBS domain-containing protein